MKIERHYYNPAQLKTDVPKNWENLDDAIEAAKKYRTAQAAVQAPQQNKTPGAYIEVFEVHGVLPTCFLAGKNGYAEDYGSEDEYERQMHVIVLDDSECGSGDRMVTVVGSTARLTTAEMMDYIDRVIALASELGCVVQTPEEAEFISNNKSPVTAYEDRTN